MPATVHPKLFSGRDLRFVGSGILQDLTDFVRLGLDIDLDTLIDTQMVVDVRAPKDTHGFGQDALKHQEKEIEKFGKHAADWCRSNHVLERYRCYDQYAKGWYITHRLYEWDADEDGNLLWRARNYLFFDVVVPVLYCLRVALGLRSLQGRIISVFVG